MAKLTARKNSRRSGPSSSSKAKENRRQSPGPVAAPSQSQPRPKPRPTGKSTKSPRDSTVLSNTSNNDPEVRSVAEALVSMSSTGSTNAPSATPTDWHYHVMSPAGVQLVAVSDLEDSEEENDDEIDQLDSDNSDDEEIFDGMSIP